MLLKTSIPIIFDGDTGYGNSVNVFRTVRGYADAGAAGVMIEDQKWPKKCGPFFEILHGVCQKNHQDPTNRCRVIC